MMKSESKTNPYTNLAFTFSPQGDGNLHRKRAVSSRSRLSSTLSPQGDGNAFPFILVYSGSNGLSSTLSPQGDGNFGVLRQHYLGPRDFPLHFPRKGMETSS